MAYTTITNLKNYLPEEEIIKLTDDHQTGDIDMEKVNFAITQAGDIIDMYCQGRYPTPLIPVTPIVSDMCTKLAVYFLYKRSLALTLPEVIKIDYKEAMAHLQMVQRGEVALMPETQNPEWFLSGGQGSDYMADLNKVTNNWQNYFI